MVYLIISFLSEIVRTRGAFNYRGENSSQGEARKRLTASARRRRETGTDAHIEDPTVEEHTFETHVEEEEHQDVLQIDEMVGGFPRSPHDPSLLTHYVQHVAYAIWQGWVSGKLELYLLLFGLKKNYIKYYYVGSKGDQVNLHREKIK